MARRIVTPGPSPRTEPAPLAPLERPRTGRSLVERLNAEAGALPVVRLPGVGVRRLPVFTDVRGSLSIAEYDQHVPFVVRRHFAMLDVPAQSIRGDHAHRACHQFFICLRGACTIGVDDGRVQDQLVLESPAVGVHAPPLTWCTVRLDLPGTVLLTLASDAYDADDYIHNYPEFLRLAAMPCP